MKHRVESSNNEGFSTIASLVIIMTVSILASSLFIVVATNKKHLESYQKKMATEKEIDTFITKFIEDFQVILNDKADMPTSINKNNLLYDYKEYNLTLKDVSTGINEDLMDNSFLKSSGIANLLFVYKDDIKSSYGYVNYRYSKKELIDFILKDYDAKSVLDAHPSINSFPMYNVYNMNYDFLSAIIQFSGIKDYNEKTKEIIEKTTSNTELSTKDIELILGVNENANILDFLGVKTVFWQADFIYKTYNITLIIRAVPVLDTDKGSSVREIEKYVLTKKSYISTS